ncbi:cytoplasmic FMR1-interacting protein 2-like isoform X2 [Clytia hemisphaerica]|uniref:Cytoplasmic FMR1-interacting protein n=1 Tax=Clytia hemisphaerica TaxID=252671 RepID=A0A7M5WYG8_9CNID
MATLQEAIENVRRLENLSLNLDEQANIEAPPASITYTCDFDTNFGDKEAFITGIARYMEEAGLHQQLSEMLESGESYACMLYTWRCLSRAVPTAKSDEQQNRQEMYQSTLDVMKPHIQRLKDFMYFHESSTSAFCKEVKRLCHPERRKDFVSETHLLTLGKCINMFAVLGSLKNMKACLNNDFAFYKRAETFLKQTTGDEKALQESQNLTMFLATHDIITSKLKSSLEEIEGYDELLADIINLCVHFYEFRMYVLPKEKHLLLKVIGFTLFLLDGKACNINKLDQKKKINISKIDKIFKSLPVVPLYGDMQISLISYVKSCPHFESARWSCAADNAEEKIGSTQYNLTGKIALIQDEHLRFMCEISKTHNEYSNNNPRRILSPEECKSLSDLALRGLRLISSWNAQVMELFYWKLLHLTDRYSNPMCPEDAENYERATRYNYDSNEKYALVQVIAMIKGVTGAMRRLEAVFSSAIRYYIHAELQEFVQITMREPLRKATKNSKKTHMRTILKAVRDTAIDLSKNAKEDPALRGEKDPKSGFHIDIPNRPVGPSTTQLYMLRTMLESLISEKSGRGKDKSFRKDLDSATVTAIEAFLRSSLFYPYLLKFDQMLKECGDLSQLWYREFFLELTMGQRIQFPIEMSMPWILTDHILQAKDAAMMEYVLLPLDLYNDSADYALNVFKKRFLYDEVEAEVNLCFDQFVFRLSEDIYSHYKQVASSMLLDKKFRSELERRYVEEKRPFPADGIIPFPPTNRFHTLILQRHVQLLGRSVDLNKLLEQRLTISLQKSLDVIITKFESGPLCGIMELENLIEINRLTHRMLSKYVQLPEFSSMIREANHAVSAPYGRITLHVFWELYYDFLPNYCFNAATDRFTRTTYSFVSEVTRDQPPKTIQCHFYGNKELHSAYTSVFSLYENFVGTEHFGCIVRLLSYQGIAVVIEELLKIVQSLFQGTIQQYIQVLMDGMPGKCGLPRFEYGSAGVLEFYNANLESIMQYRDLKTEVFQAFREVGNIIIFCLQVEELLTQEEIADLLHAAPFQGIIPRPYVKDKDSVEQKMKRLEAQYAAFQIVSLVGRYGSDQQRQNSEESDVLTRERLCCGLSLFEVVLRRIQSFLTDDAWKEPTPANGVMSIEECREFHRLWSAIQFIYCKPLGEHEITVEETFGESLNWAGITLIMLLRQEHRFEALDFCNHILRVQEIDSRQEVVAGVDLKRLIRRIKEYQTINKHIMAVLKRYLKSGDSSSVEQVRCFQPPIHQAFMSSV